MSWIIKPEGVTEASQSWSDLKSSQGI